MARAVVDALETLQRFLTSSLLHKQLKAPYNHGGSQFQARGQTQRALELRQSRKTEDCTENRRATSQLLHEALQEQSTEP
jgi:hypothetical protein